MWPLAAVLFGGDDSLADRAWELDLDLRCSLDVAVTVPAVTAVQGAVVATLGGHAAVVAAEVRLDALRRAVEACAGVAVLATPATGRTNVRLAYRLARASALAVAKTGRRGVLALDDCLALAALAGDADARRAYVDAVVAPLHAAAPMAAVLPTLLALQDAGWHAPRAAAQLGIHPNTLRYRLNLAEGATGLSIKSGRDRDRLSLALWLWRLLR